MGIDNIDHLSSDVRNSSTILPSEALKGLFSYASRNNRRSPGLLRPAAAGILSIFQQFSFDLLRPAAGGMLSIFATVSPIGFKG